MDPASASNWKQRQFGLAGKASARALTSKHFPDRRASSERYRTIVGGVERFAKIHPQLSINGRRIVVRRVGLLSNETAVTIGRTDDLSARHAGSSHRNAVGVRPVIAALVLVYLGCSSKLSNETDQGILEQTSIVHVSNQRGECLVDAAHHPPSSKTVTAAASATGTRQVAGGVGVDKVVVIPVQIRSAGRLFSERLSNIDGDETYTLLNQTPANEVTLSAMPATILVASLFGFQFEIKSGLAVGMQQAVPRLSDRILPSFRFFARVDREPDVQVA